MAGLPWSDSKWVQEALRDGLFLNAAMLLRSWLNLETTPSPRNFREENCDEILSSLPMPLRARSRRLSAMAVLVKLPDLMTAKSFLSFCQS